MPDGTDTALHSHRTFQVRVYETVITVLAVALLAVLGIVWRAVVAELSALRDRVHQIEIQQVKHGERLSSVWTGMEELTKTGKDLREFMRSRSQETSGAK